MAHSFSRATAVVTLLALVVLAGCGGLLGSDTATETGPDLSNVTLPPGIDESGIAGLDGRRALFDAHRSELASSGFRYTFEYVEKERDTAIDFSGVATNRSGSVAATAGLAVHRTERVVHDSGRRAVTWSNGTVGGERVETNETTFGRYDEDASPRIADHHLVDRFLRFGDWEITEVRNDTGWIVLTADRADPDVSVTAPELSLTDFDGRLVVDPSGRIRYLHGNISSGGEFTVAGEFHDVSNHDVFTYELTRVGNVSLPPPEWIDEVPREDDAEG